jgi:hypothetical protein
MDGSQIDNLTSGGRRGQQFVRQWFPFCVECHFIGGLVERGAEQEPRKEEGEQS